VLGVAGAMLVCVRVGEVKVQEGPLDREVVVVEGARAARSAAAVLPDPPAPPPTPSATPSTSTPTSPTPSPPALPTTTSAEAAGAVTLEDCRKAYARERYSRIVRLCSQVLELQGAVEPAQRAGVMAMLAHAELDRGNYQRARGWARKALGLDPRLSEAYAYLGFVEDQAGRRDDALAAYRSYLELAPQGRYADDIRAIVEAP
jgi:tetratricopeptide (TPR) repeat protein